MQCTVDFLGDEQSNAYRNVDQDAEQIEEPLHDKPDVRLKEDLKVLNLFVEADVVVEAVVEVADHER